MIKSRPHPVFGSRADRRPDIAPAAQVAAVYDNAGTTYSAYADGDLSQLFSFQGPHGYADDQIWRVLDDKLTSLRHGGATSIRILDAGCGPGTWLRRMVVRAVDLGFESIDARGFDISYSQIELARRCACSLADIEGVNLTFEVADLTESLREADGTVDIAVCLYSVLSHLPGHRLRNVSRELARVTSGHLVVSVRSIGSMPSAFVCPMETVRYLRRDHDLDQCEIELRDHSRATFLLHLFDEAELRACFAQYFVVEDLRGLDLFHSRFAPDDRWSPPRLRADVGLAKELAMLEEMFATRPGFIDRAMHIMLVGRKASGVSANNPRISWGVPPSRR